MNGVSDIIAPFNVDAANDDNYYVVVITMPLLLLPEWAISPLGRHIPTGNTSQSDKAFAELPSSKANWVSRQRPRTFARWNELNLRSTRPKSYLLRW